MELKTFIEKTLTEIVDGVANANKVHNNKFKIIGETKPPGQGIANPIYGSFVDFDIGITVNESDDTKGKSGLMVAVGSLLAGKSKTETNSHSMENMNHLKFRVFIHHKE